MIKMKHTPPPNAYRDTYGLNNSLTSYPAKADSSHANKLRNLPANLKRTRPTVSQPIACLCGLKSMRIKKRTRNLNSLDSMSGINKQICQTCSVATNVSNRLQFNEWASTCSATVSPTEHLIQWQTPTKIQRYENYFSKPDYSHC